MSGAAPPNHPFGTGGPARTADAGRPGADRGSSGSHGHYGGRPQGDSQHRGGGSHHRPMIGGAKLADHAAARSSAVSGTRSGTTQQIDPSAPAARQGGFECTTCDRFFKDSLSYLEHCNSRGHLVRSGVDPDTLQKSTKEDVRAAFAHERDEMARIGALGRSAEAVARADREAISGTGGTAEPRQESSAEFLVFWVVFFLLLCFFFGFSIFSLSVLPRLITSPICTYITKKKTVSLFVYLTLCQKNCSGEGDTGAERAAGDDAVRRAEEARVLAKIDAAAQELEEKRREEKRRKRELDKKRRREGTYGDGPQGGVN
jgi:hypothetical protein